MAEFSSDKKEPRNSRNIKHFESSTKEFIQQGMLSVAIK